MITHDEPSLKCQKAIFIADILRKHFVCSPSLLYQFPLFYLEDISRSSELFILDPSDFVYKKGIPQYGFFVH